MCFYKLTCMYMYMYMCLYECLCMFLELFAMSCTLLVQSI